MFGLRKVHGLSRKAYDARMEEMLKMQMGIETDDAKNPLFPGFLRFADLKGHGWHKKISAEFNALAIGISYLGGASRAGDEGLREARRIFVPVQSTLEEASRHKLISRADAAKFQVTLDQISMLLK